MKKLILVSIGIILYSFQSVAQEEDLGLNPSDLKWQVLKTPAADIIYPTGADSTAQRVANIVNYQQEYLTESLGKKKRRLGIVLQHTGVIPNAFVQLAPFKSVFFGTPTEEMQSLGSTNWMDVLAIHEYRHIQQLSNTLEGLSMVAYILTGEQGWAISQALSIPNWYFEGDAVYAETAFTHSGRGRIPHFTNQQRALAQAGIHYDYEKARNGSLKDLVPDHYRTGYMILSHLRNEKGKEVMTPIIKEAASYKGLFYPFNKAMVRHTGYTTPNLYNTASYAVKEAWQAQLDSTTLLPTQPITTKDEETVTNYYFPRTDENGDIIAFKNSFKETDQLVRLTDEGEEVITAPGVNLGQYYYHSKGKYVWTEYRQNPRRTNESFSEILLLDEKKGTQKKITKKGKYFWPIINQTGSEVIAIRFSPEQRASLVRIDPITHLETTLHTFLFGEYISGLSYDQTEEHVVYLFKKNNLLSIKKHHLKTNQNILLTPETAHVINAPQVHDEHVYYSASYSGIDNIYRVSLTGDQQIEQLTSVKIGAYHPFMSDNGQLLFTEHTHKGRMISSMNLSDQRDATPRVIHVTEPQLMQWQDHISSPEIDNFVAQAPDSSYASKKYNGLFRGLKLHSWGFAASNVQSSLDLVLNNYLDDLSLVLSPGYNFNEKGAIYNAQINYGRWYPIFSLEAQSAERSASIISGDNILFQSFTEQTFSASASVPLQWVHGNFSTSVNSRLSYNHHLINNIEIGNTDRPSIDFNTASGLLEFDISRRTANQNLAPRLGLSATARYAREVETSNNEKINFSSQIYLPGLAKNHSLRFKGRYQKELLSNPLQTIDDFEYTRGFEPPANDEFMTLSVEYAFPLLYPDVGFFGITYFQRISANVFYDYGQGSINLLSEDIDYQSAGVELLFDNTIFNVLPITYGWRASYLITEDPLNLDERFVSSFFIAGRL